MKHSLEPALETHLRGVAELAERDPSRAADLLFEFNVVDPAMGSAHFLTMALDAMADRIQRFLAEQDRSGRPILTIRALLDSLKAEADGGAGRVFEDGQFLRRLILKRCIYGVDFSPMAVEIANISLWLASFAPGLALSYLGSNLKVGDSLIGAADMAAHLKTSPMFLSSKSNPHSLVATALFAAQRAARELARVPDRTPEEVALSQRKHRELQEATAGLERCLDFWCAEPLGVTGARHVLDDDQQMKDTLAGRAKGKVAQLLNAAQEEAGRRRFFHWPLAFPLVFLRERPGFDAVIGNPPWNEVTLEELAFYALHDPGLRGVVHEPDRRARIQELDRHYPQLRPEFEQRRQDMAPQRRFFTQTATSSTAAETWTSTGSSANGTTTWLGRVAGWALCCPAARSWWRAPAVSVAGFSGRTPCDGGTSC